MSVSEPRPQSAAPARGSPAVWGLIVILSIVFVGLTVYRVRTRDLNQVNEDRLNELKSSAPKPEPPPPASADWPQWRGPNRDGVSAETGLLTTWPEDGPKVLWQKPSGQGYSSVVVARGYVFTILQHDEANEAVVCWEADTGVERWRFKYPAHLYQQYGDGPRSTPAIAGEHIYTVGGTGVMHCLKAFTSNPAGEMVWRKDLLQDLGGRQLEWGVSFSPLVEGGLVYVMPGGASGNSLAAFDKDTGSVVWQSFDDRPSYSSPVGIDVGGKRQIVFLTGERLMGVDPPTGKLFWEVPWDSGLGHAPTNIATPLAIHLESGDYLFISSGYGRGCALFKIEAEGAAYRASQVYRNKNLGTIFATCVRQGDYLYGFNESSLTCLELRTGAAKWRKSGFGKGSVALADGHLIILGDTGTLALAVADPQKYREISRFEHSDQPSSWTGPVVAGGRLYVRDKKTLTCYDIKKSP